MTNSREGKNCTRGCKACSSASNSWKAIMNKFLIAIGLVIGISAPALAALEKAQSRPDRRHIESNSGNRWTGRKSHIGSYRDQVDDPYWSPCDYTSPASENYCE